MPSAWVNLLRASSASPMPRMAPQNAYVVNSPVDRPVSSILATLTCTDAWSLAPMTVLEAELFELCGGNENGGGGRGDGRKGDEKFEYD